MEKDRYIAIKLKLLEIFKVIFIYNTEINISKTTFTFIKIQIKNNLMYNLIF